MERNGEEGGTGARRRRPGLLRRVGATDDVAERPADGEQEQREEQELEDFRPVLSRVLPPDWEHAIAARDQAAFDASVRRAWLVVYYRVVARTGNRDEAEEAAQEVFCRVLARMGSRPDGEAVRRAYLARAATNLLQDQWQRKERRLLADTAFAADRSGEPVDPLDAVVRGAETDQLVAALRGLPPIQAQVLRLRIGEELSSEEAGAVLGKSAQAVRQIQHRALEALRARLREPEPGEG